MKGHHPSQRHHKVVHHYLRREARGVQHLFDLEGLPEPVGPAARER
ncbi:hypothetical protein [Allomeiothermus silvanus]|nr:hypothetical protein [Allomeiothermus silvanus]